MGDVNNTNEVIVQQRKIGSIKSKFYLKQKVSVGVIYYLKKTSFNCLLHSKEFGRM